jgi:hypothetical protein
MPKFRVSIFTENERIINSQTFNHPTIGDLEKELQKILFELTFNKRMPDLKGRSHSTLIQEISRDNIKWIYLVYEKKNKVIKYFISIEQYNVHK